MEMDLRRSFRLAQALRLFLKDAVILFCQRPWQLLLLLPLVGLAVLARLLWHFPMYPDEIQWNIINSRMLLDGGKLIYFFPACETGLLVNTPISWYPSRLLDAVLLSDMSDQRLLRTWSIGIMLALTAYAAWIAQRLLRPSTPLLLTFAALAAPLTLGVLPFLLAFSRPEKAILIPMFIGCTLPLLLPTPSKAAAWLLALLYILLAWMVSSAHPKGIFLLPALVVSGYFVIRRSLPAIAMTITAAFGAFETFRLWELRTNCPESQFLTTIFRTLSISLSSVRDGMLPFLATLWANALNGSAYWRHIFFQTAYQSNWLPDASSPLTSLEWIINLLIPPIVAIAFALIFMAIIFEAITAVRFRTWPPRRVTIAALLTLGLLAIASFQITKNFYEAGLQGPILGLAVILALPSLLNFIPSGRTIGMILVAGIAVVSGASQIANANRLGSLLPIWQQSRIAEAKMRAQVEDLIGKCGLENTGRMSRIIMDDRTYSVLWRTREPLLTTYFYGWWATGLDQALTLKMRKITAIVGACASMRPEDERSAIRSGTYCCRKLGPLDLPN